MLAPSLDLLTVKRIKINLPLLLPVPISLVLNWCLTFASKRPQMTGMYKITKTREQVCIVSSSADNSRLIIIVKINKKEKKWDKKKKNKKKEKHLNKSLFNLLISQRLLFMQPKSNWTEWTLTKRIPIGTHQLIVRHNIIRIVTFTSS